MAVDPAALERYELFEHIKDVFGPDVIMVHKPEELDYFITQSSNVPARTKQILKQVLENMKGLVDL